MALPLFALGIDGAISTIGNAFPDAFGEMIDLLTFGALNEARKRHHELAPIMRLLELEGKPTAIKSVLAQLNRCHGAVRLPNTPVSEQTQMAIYKTIAELPEHISNKILETNS
jgi:4-hydroxy-tetrahydrodipicolinate synthase